jgi:hypothetical protein
MSNFFGTGTIRDETDPEIFWRADRKESIEISSIDQVTPEVQVKELSIDPDVRARGKIGRRARRGKRRTKKSIHRSRVRAPPKASI